MGRRRGIWRGTFVWWREGNNIWRGLLRVVNKGKDLIYRMQRKGRRKYMTDERNDGVHI